MAMGKHYGSFGKGFADGLIAMMRLGMTMQLYKARAQYYKDRGWAATHPHGKALTDAERQAEMDKAKNDPNYGRGGGGGGGVAGNAGELKNFYISQGYTPEGASAVVGNWQQENSLRGGGWGGDKGMSAGGFQWHDDPSKGLARGTGFMNWAKANNLDVNDPMTSAKYSVIDLKKNYPDLDKYLRTTKDVDEATQKFEKDYEGAGIPAMENRLAAARTVYRTTPATPKTEKTTTAKAETVADKPTKEATAESADIPASGGGFRIPGDSSGDVQLPGRGPTEDPASAGAGSPPREPAPLPITRLSPETQRQVDIRAYPDSTSYPQSGPGIPSGPTDPSIIARQKMAAQLPQPRPNVGPTPSSVPDVGTEPPGTQFARPAPPAAPMMPPRTTTPPTAYPAGTIYGPSQPSAADKPSPAATPVSAVTPRVTAPTDTSPFVAIDRPNADPTQRNRGSPQGTALDLSHLWGANPPVSARGGVSQAQPGPDLAQRVPLDRTPMPPIKPPDNFDDVASGIAMGSRKGGPIQRFANGGIPQRPTMRFQGGGYAPGGGSAGAVTEPYVNQTATVPGYTYNPGYSSGANLQMEQNQALYGTPTPAPTADFGAAWGKLTPAQQNWYTQSAVAGNYNQANANPYPVTPAATPAPAPATPAPPPAPIVNPTTTSTVAPVVDTTITDPTSTTTTGAPGLPNSIQAKSYDPNVDATTGAGFANTANAGGTNYSVGTDDTLNQTTPGTISGSRKGGPIRRYEDGGEVNNPPSHDSAFEAYKAIRPPPTPSPPPKRYYPSSGEPGVAMLAAKGGGIPARPTMRFATGGGAAASTLLSPNYSGPMAGGGWTGTPYADMSPNQQTWATQQQTLLGQEKVNANNPGWSGWSQLSGTPAAIWPTVAPAAPTPIAEPGPTSTSTVTPAVDTTVTDPTSTTTTGAPGIPNAITANSYNPNVDATTGAGFANTANAGGTNYSVGTDDTLNQTTPGTISGSRKGGSITRKLPKRVTKRYDLGGGVDESGDVSASPLGMPPGLAQGGQQQIPPYYFNPATYSAAGAPVGKGVTQTSAPTFKAMAIPSLPMMRGGIVGYDDGGGVDPGASDMANLQNMEFADAREEADHPDAQPAAPPTTQYDASGAPTTDVDPGEFLHPADTTDATGAQPTGGRDNSPPPDPTTPQVSDDAGNPSKGLIGAITSGLHWLAEHLGVGGAQAAQPAIAGDPQTQTARQQFATHDPNGATYISKQSVEELNDIADPEHQLQGNYRNIAGLEAGWRWAMAHGDTQNAGRLSAALLHYSVVTSQNLSQQARDSLYKGDLQKAVDYTNQALDAVPDGRNIRLTYDPKTNQVKVTGSTLTGQQLWEQYGSAPEVLERATALGAQGKLQWNALESQAATYDHTFAGMQKARRENMIAGGKETAITAANEKFGDKPPVTPPSNAAAPAAPAPALPGPPPVGGATISAQATPPVAPQASPGSSPDSAGGSQTPAAPPSADSNVIADQRGTPIAGLSDRTGIPSGPTAPTETAQQPISLADATRSPEQPAPAAAPVSDEVGFERIVASLNNQEAVGRQQVVDRAEAEAQKHYEPYPDQSLIQTPEDRAAYNLKVTRVKAQHAEVDKAKAEYIAANQKAISDRIAAQRAAVTEEYKTTAAATLESNKQKDAAKAADVANTRETGQKQLQSQLTQANDVFSANLKGSTPRTPEDFIRVTGSNFDPYISLAQAFNPDLDPATTNQAQAINALDSMHLDRNTQNVLANALNNGITHSLNTSPQEVASAIQNFVSGNQFFAKAEATQPRRDAQGNIMKDGQGNPLLVQVPVHNVMRYDVTVLDNTGNVLSVRLPASDLINLRNIQARYVPQAMTQLGRDVHSQGLLNLKPGVTPNQQTRLGISGSEDEPTFNPPPRSGGYNPAQSSGWDQPPF